MKNSIVLSDHPWCYDDKATSGERGADFKYATMTMRDLSKLRIGDLAAENSVLCMWATGPLMDEAIRMMRRYGFKYKGILFTWIKTNPKSGGLFMGMGHYSRSNPEFIIFGVRGKLPVQSHSVHSVIMAPRGRHSAKPDEARERIVELFGDVPRVELFARSKCEGWTQTGLEMDGMNVVDFINKESPQVDIRSLSKLVDKK